MRLDKEFGEMLGKIADRKDRLLHMERKLAALDRTRLGKEVRSSVSLGRWKMPHGSDGAVVPSIMPVEQCRFSL